MNSNKISLLDGYKIEKSMPLNEILSFKNIIKNINNNYTGFIYLCTLFKILYSVVFFVFITFFISFFTNFFFTLFGVISAGVQESRDEYYRVKSAVISKMYNQSFMIYIEILFLIFILGVIFYYIYNILFSFYNEKIYYSFILDIVHILETANLTQVKSISFNRFFNLVKLIINSNLFIINNFLYLFLVGFLWIALIPIITFICSFTSILIFNDLYYKGIEGLKKIDIDKIKELEKNNEELIRQIGKTHVNIMPSFDFPENNIDNPDDQYEEYKKKFNTIKNCIDLVLQYKWQILLDTKFKKNQTTHTMTLESMSIMERITDMLKININKIENNSAISNIESLIESIKNNKNEKEYFSIFYLYFLPFFCNTRYAIGFKHEKNISFVSILNIAYNHTQYRCMFFSNLLIDLFASYITGLIIVGIIYISIFNPQMILKYDKNILENDGIINFENELQSLNSIFFFTSFEFLFAIFFVFIFSRILFGSSLVYQLGFIGNNLYRNNLFGIDNMILHYTEVFKKSVNIKEGISSFKMPFALANFINILMEKSSASSSEHHQLIINMKEGFLDKAITPTNKINPESIKEILITTAKIYDILKYNYMIEDFLYKLFAKYNENKKSKISITDLPKVDTSDISNLLKEIGRTITSISLLDSISSMNGSSPINAIKTILEHNSKNNKEINFVIPLLVEGPIQYQIKFIQNLTASVLFFLLAYSSNKFIDFFRYYCNFIFNLQDFINSIFLYKYSLRKILPVEVFSNGTFNIIPLGVACKYFNFYYEINKVPNDDEPVKREQVQIFKDLNFNVIPLNIQPYVLRYLNNTLIMNKVEYNCGWSNVTAVLSGKSGSGKSTLFDIMAMFFKNWNNGYLAFIGTDEYGKLNIINASLLDKRSLRKNIIYISQNLGALRAGYKVYELIDLFGSGGNKEILFYILDYFGIKIDLEQDVANLSGGEFKILCIGLAFLNNCNRLFYENGKIRFSSEIQLILNDEVDKGMDPARRSLFNVLMINASSMLIKYNRKYATNMASIHFNDIYSRSTNNLDFKRTGLLHIKEIQAPYRNATCLSISHFGDEQNILFRYNIDKVFKILKVYLARSSNLIKNFTDNSDLMKD